MNFFISSQQFIFLLIFFACVGKPVAALAQGLHCIPQVWEDHGQERMLTVPAVRIVVKVEDSFGFATLLAFPPLSQEFCHRPARRPHVDVSVDELLESHVFHDSMV